MRLAQRRRMAPLVRMWGSVWLQAARSRQRAWESMERVRNKRGGDWKPPGDEPGGFSMGWRCGGGFGFPPLRRSICPVFLFCCFQRGTSLALGLKPPHGLCGRLRAALGNWAWSGLGCTLSGYGGLLLLTRQVPGAGDAG